MMRETDSACRSASYLFRPSRFTKMIVILRALLNNPKFAATSGVLHESQHIPNSLTLGALLPQTLFHTEITRLSLAAST
jgi:hypothetical protein